MPAVDAFVCYTCARLAPVAALHRAYAPGQRVCELCCFVQGFEPDAPASAAYVPPIFGDDLT